MTEDNDDTKQLQDDNAVQKIEDSGDVGNSGSGDNREDKGKTTPEPDGNDKAKIDADIGLVGGDAEIAENITKINQQFKQFYFGNDKSSEIKKFSLSNTIPIPEEVIHTVKKVYVYPEEKKRALHRSLSSNRILLLVGESETGKYTTAQYVAGQMKNEKTYEVRLIAPLDRGIDINLMELSKDPEALKGKILIFKDVFSKKNQKLIDFFASSSQEERAFISAKLAERDAFFLFTANTGTFDRQQLDNMDIKMDIHPIDDDLRQEGFRLKLEQFCSLNYKIDFRKASDLLDEKKKEIIEKFDRMSKIVLFIENYLEKIMVYGKSIDSAIEEVNDVKKQVEFLFLKDLGGSKEDFEAWTFALCLALFNNCSYTDFNEIHKQITRILITEFNPFNFDKEFSFRLSENELLEKSNAQITKNMITHADAIEFCDHRYQDVLMDILLKNNRKVLLSIIPYLEDYTEDHYRINQRRLAAYSLARIGEIDSEAITLPLIIKWANMKEYFHKVNVGYLYEGIFTSKDDVYRKFCMSFLRRIALSSDINQLLTAIAAYTRIGFHDLKFAMEQLRKIQEKIIERRIKKENLLDILFSQTNLLKEQGVLVNLDQLYKETNNLLSTVRYSILAFSISTIIDPIDVFSQLHEWIRKGNSNSRVSVVLFTLGTDGILQELESREIIYLSNDEEKIGEELRSNFLLYSLAAGDNAVKKLAAFLTDLYKDCFSEFRMDIHNSLKDVLFGHLEKWSVKTLSNSKVNNAIKKLILRLYNSGDEEFRDTIWNSLNSWNAPENKETQLKEFVDDVTKQIFEI
jgi:energy-coupling factor transporter ATP-binding protein EcfA2